eukprot:gene24428-29299_t
MSSPTAVRSSSVIVSLSSASNLGVPEESQSARIGRRQAPGSPLRHTAQQPLRLLDSWSPSIEVWQQHRDSCARTCAVRFDRSRPPNLEDVQPTTRHRARRRVDPALENPQSLEEPQELLPRKRPTQERSQRKFDALLAASRELLTDVGFESLTCEEVAARADVPIGTLYQFFANKYVIVCELNRQDLVGVQHELAQFGGEVPSLDWLRFLNSFVDHMAGLW